MRIKYGKWRIEDHLSGLTGESTEWPSDEKFAEAWKTHHASAILQNARIVYILKRLNDTYMPLTQQPESCDS